MKKLIFVFVALLALVSVVSAQESGSSLKPVIYAGAGIALPLSPDVIKDNFNMGFGFGAGGGIEVSPGIELIAKIFYNTFSFDDQDGALDGDDLKAIEFGVDGKYVFLADQPNAKLRPFLSAGIGMANVDAGDESETKLAFNGGGGIDYMFSPKTGIFVEGRLNVVTTEGDSFNYFPIRAGLKFLLGN